MNELRTTCPGCGKPVVFHGSFSMSSICDACGMIVVRPDYGQNAGDAYATLAGGTPTLPNAGGTPTLQEGLASNGTIATPLENDSPLELGMQGYYQGHHFEIRGVVRLEHDAGGFWDEWYLLFDDGRWGWLAEVQRHFYLTFAVELKQAAKIPVVPRDSPGRAVSASSGRGADAGCRKGIRLSPRHAGRDSLRPRAAERSTNTPTSPGRAGGSPRSITESRRPRSTSAGKWPWATCTCRTSRKILRTNRGTSRR